MAHAQPQKKVALYSAEYFGLCGIGTCEARRSRSSEKVVPRARSAAPACVGMERRGCSVPGWCGGRAGRSADHVRVRSVLRVRAGGILSCGLTHAAVTPLDVVKCNVQVRTGARRR